MFIWECKETGGNPQKSVVHAACLVHVVFQNHQTQLNGGFSSYSNVYGNTSCSHQMVFLVLPCMSHRPINPAHGELWGSKVSLSLHQQGTTRRAVGFHATCRGTDCTGKFASHKAHLQILRAISDEFWGKYSQVGVADISRSWWSQQVQYSKMI